MSDHWPDGTPIRRGPEPEGPWGAELIERWVRLLAEDGDCLLWDRGGLPRDVNELMISATLQARFAAWGAWLERERTRFYETNRYAADGRLLHYWEDWPDAQTKAFNEEGRSLGEALRAELPADWTVVVHDL